MEALNERTPLLGAPLVESRRGLQQQNWNRRPREVYVSDPICWESRAKHGGPDHLVFSHDRPGPLNDACDSSHKKCAEYRFDTTIELRQNAFCKLARTQGLEKSACVHLVFRLAVSCIVVAAGVDTQGLKHILHFQFDLTSVSLGRIILLSVAANNVPASTGRLPIACDESIKSHGV